MMNRAQHLAGWLGRRFPTLSRAGYSIAGRALTMACAELAVLATLCLVAGGVWAFINIADEVGEGETDAFDQAVLLALRNPADLSDPLGPMWFEEAMRDVTALGSTVVLTFATVAVIGFLLLVRNRGAALLVFASVAGGTLLGYLLKDLFARPRPELVAHGAAVFTASFPSNHAMLSAVTYLTLGALLARLEVRRRAKIYFLALSIVITMAVGLSRLYLGVHWPTDVLAGWCIGGAWALAVWTMALWLQRHGSVRETDTG